MAAFASVADLSAYLQEPIPDGDATATILLDLATATIKAYTRQSLEAVDGATVTLYGEGRRLVVLPELPVRDVTSVTVSGTLLDVGDYSWTGTGLLRRTGGAVWPIEAAIDVVYNYGFVSIPDSLRAICLSAAARSYANPALVNAESVGSYSVTYGDQASVGVDLLSSEKLLLDAYRHRGLT